MSQLFLKFEDGKQRTFDASTLDDADKCLEFYRLRNLERWRPVRQSTSASWGTATHSCLEVYDKALVAGLSSAEAADLTVQKAIELGEAFRNSDDPARTHETLVRAVVWYMAQFEADPLITAQLPSGKAAIEIRFELPIPNTNLRLSGRIDRLTHLGKGLYPVDRKTTKKTLAAQYWNAFLPGIQIPTYLWALRQLGFDPEGFIIEACQTMVSGCRWRRQQFQVHSDHLKEFEQDVLIGLTQRIAKAHETGQWERRRSSCTLYGGCQFRDVCNASPSQRHRYLEDRFERVPYTPRPTEESSE